MNTRRHTARKARRKRILQTILACTWLAGVTAWLWRQ